MQTYSQLIEQMKTKPSQETWQEIERLKNLNGGMPPVSWYAAKTGNHQGLVCDERTGRSVAVAYDSTDAPLIAAAPELLAACEQAIITLDPMDSDHVDLYRMLVSAIAKAKGQP